MKKLLLSTVALLSLLSVPTFLTAQKDAFAYVITDVNKDGANWSFLRKLDTRTGAYSDVLLQGNDATSLAYDAASRKQMTTPMKDERFGNLANAAFATGVAAIAYDKRHDRLYYTPMFIDQLRYIDLRTMKVFFVNNTALTGIQVKASDQSNIVTRMTIASDGNGYALTNDGRHLIKFTTGKNVTVTDLGTVVDDPANKDVSIHASCTSFGGDMVADDDDNLYVFSARNHVFKIDINSKVATHLGSVTGLPPSFTINGAAVTEDNKVILSSAVDNSSLFVLDTKTWTATAGKAGPWKGSDLANSNLLSKPGVGVPQLQSADTEIGDGRVRLFPNPVTHRNFNMQFDLEAGNYTVQVLDVSGRQALQSVINIKGAGQVEAVQLPSTSKSGVYLVKLVDHQLKTVFSKKVLVN